MNLSVRLALILAGAGAAGLVAAWVLTRVRRWRRKSPAELERLRRLDVNRRGRITTGKIVDLIEPNPGQPGTCLAAYKYELAGVTYEAAQDVSVLPKACTLLKLAGGQMTSVKYDPKTPTNSIIACEEWCGVSDQATLAKDQGLEEKQKPGSLVPNS